MSFIWRKWNQLKQVHQEIFERVQKQTHQGIKGLSEGTLNQPPWVTERSMGPPFSSGFFISLKTVDMTSPIGEAKWTMRQQKNSKKKQMGKKVCFLSIMTNFVQVYEAYESESNTIIKDVRKPTAITIATNSADMNTQYNKQFEDINRNNSPICSLFKALFKWQHC